MRQILAKFFAKLTIFTLGSIITELFMFFAKNKMDGKTITGKKKKPKAEDEELEKYRKALKPEQT